MKQDTEMVPYCSRAGTDQFLSSNRVAMWAMHVIVRQDLVDLIEV